MKLKLAASLLALALALSLPAVQLHAQQAEPAPAAQPAAEVPPQILKLLEPHDLAQMSPEQLKGYEAQLRRAAGMPGLPPDVKSKLQAQASAVGAELGTRAAAEQQKQASPPPPEPPKQAAQTEPPKAMNRQPPPPQPDANAAAADDQGAADAQAAVDAKAKADRKAKMEADMKAKAAAKAAADAKAGNDAQAAADAKAQEDAKAGVDAQAAADAKAAIDRKAKMAADLKAKADAKAAADAQAATDATKQADQTQPQPVPVAPPKPPKVADQTQQAEQAGKTDPAQPPAAPPKQTAEAQPPAAPAEPLTKPLDKPVTLAPAAPPPAAPKADAAEIQKLDANPVDPAAEAKAKNYLGDNADVSKLSDDDLRKRLDDTRELLAANQLSQDTERAVRAKLLKDRDVLRSRLASAESKKEQQAAVAPAPDPKAQAQIAAQAVAVTKAPPPPPPPPPPPQGPKLNFNIELNFISPDTPPEQVLEDRRPPQDLQVSELQRRIQIYDQYVGDDRYDPSYRDYWNKNLAYDREFLRHRMKLERTQRARGQGAMQDQYDIEISPDRLYPVNAPRTAFAAEVDDQTLERMLTAAPPPRYNKPQYSVRDIATDPSLRSALPRIEVDTIHFGYNEGFVREEELSHLDNLASLIEQIVAKYPKEVFMIEGHTDAAGSADYNLKLSRLRAESVKNMMTTYYNIPAKNLRTIGLGEEYLKIPTADPEPENRRVSLTRITPLLAQGQ